MPTQVRKTFWKDIGDLRKPNANWRLGRAARWYENILDLPDGAVRFTNADGSTARSNKKLGSLRRDWDRRLR
jgi:hypothetical protein